MNVFAHEKENEKMREKEAKEQKTDRPFQRECCPSAVVQRAALQKYLIWRKLRVSWTLWEANSYFDLTRRDQEPHHHVEAAGN